jgi:hypothetical protein
MKESKLYNNIYIIISSYIITVSAEDIKYIHNFVLYNAIKVHVIPKVTGFGKIFLTISIVIVGIGLLTTGVCFLYKKIHYKLYEQLVDESEIGKLYD